jgi:hypothetical protein
MKKGIRTAKNNAVAGALFGLSLGSIVLAYELLSMTMFNNVRR